MVVLALNPQHSEGRGRRITEFKFKVGRKEGRKKKAFVGPALVLRCPMGCYLQVVPTLRQVPGRTALPTHLADCGEQKPTVSQPGQDCERQLFNFSLTTIRTYVSSP